MSKASPKQINEVCSHQILSASPSSLCVYNSFFTSKSNRSINSNSLANLKDNSTKGLLSDSGAKNLRKAIGWLVLKRRKQLKCKRDDMPQVGRKLVFITLTLPSTQIHSDNQIKKELLNQFLIEISNKWKVRNYVWRAEKQTNGSIHFHILADRYIPHLDVKLTWNRIVNKLGYVDRFVAKNGNKVPNSTDIHSLKSVKNISAYVSKYMSKNEAVQGVDGRIWFASQELLACENPKDDLDSELSLELDKFVAKYKPHVICDEYYSIICQSIFSVNLDDFPRLAALVEVAEMQL